MRDDMTKRIQKRLTSAAGFTLVELMATLVILSLILAIAVPAVGNITAKAGGQADKVSVSMIEDAAEMALLGEVAYSEDAPEAESYTVPDLVESGYLKLEKKSIFNSKLNYAMRIPGGKFLYKGKKPDESAPPEVTPEPEPEPDLPEVMPASDFTYDFKGKDGTVRVLKYLGTATDVVIPRKFKNPEDPSAPAQPTTEIGVQAFYGTTVPTSVDIPDTVTTIGDHAFYRAKLTSVTLPAQLESLGKAVFASAPITEIELPSSLVRIGDSAFTSMKLTTVTVPETVQVLGSSVFASNPLTSVTLPDSMKVIPNGTFSSTQLTNITLPTALESIGDSAFHSAKLTSITLPDGLKTIERFAFSHNDLTAIAIPSQVATIGDSAFSFNRITRVDLPASVATIGSQSFGSNKTVKGAATNAAGSITTARIRNAQAVIAYDAFAYSEPQQTYKRSLTIQGPSGSTAQAFAALASNGYTFQAIN